MKRPEVLFSDTDWLYVVDGVKRVRKSQEKEARK